MFLLISLLLILAYCLLYYYYKKKFSYWRDRGVPQLEPRMPFGDLDYPWKRVPIIVQYTNFYKKFKERGAKHGGVFLFAKPLYMLIDPEYVNNITVKDFQHFTDRGIPWNVEREPLLKNLFLTKGSRWKNLRQKITPTFTTRKIKAMFHTILKCTTPLTKKIEQMSVDNEDIDIKEILTKFTTDIIGSCAFGIECNSLESSNSDLYKYGTMCFEISAWRTMKFIFIFSFQGLARKLGITIADNEAAEFFTKLATDTYNYRKENKVQRNDLMQILMELMDKNDEALTMEELLAQVVMFFLAGFDTSSATLTFCLFQLACNVDIQNRLRNEIMDILKMHDGEITYEALQEMKYMDQVMNETLRKYPVVGMLPRICTKTYKVPFTDVVIERGTPVLICPFALHNDPDLFPNPEEFDPERFLDENKGNIVQGSYIPFGGGPRYCVAARFALVQMKICLVTLLKAFEFTLSSKTLTPIELYFGFITKVKGGVWLNSKKIGE